MSEKMSEILFYYYSSPRHDVTARGNREQTQMETKQHITNIFFLVILKIDWLKPKGHVTIRGEE